MNFRDDCYVRLQYNLHNTWFQNSNDCRQTLSKNLSRFCSLYEDGGWGRTRMVNPDMRLFHEANSKGFDSYSCNGEFIVEPSVKYPNTKIVNCSSNFIQLSFDYLNATNEQWTADCLENLDHLCDTIYTTSNPFKCTKLVPNTIIDALSNGYVTDT